MSPSAFILILAVSVFTVIAMVWDARFKKIPNKLTLPMFFAGWVFQIGMSIMYGWHHLGDAFLGFLVGFGILFVLWFIGGGGGGDVKLMGALSVWLGFQLTVWVMFVSTLIVLFATVGVVLWSLISKGLKRTKQQYLGTGKTSAGQKPVRETTDDKLKRRVMTYAGPVGLATWLVLAWNYPQLNPEVGAVEETSAKNVVQPVDGKSIEAKPVATQDVAQPAKETQPVESPEGDVPPQELQVEEPQLVTPQSEDVVE